MVDEQSKLCLQVNAVDEIGCSALHLCAEHGYYHMIEVLLQVTFSYHPSYLSLYHFSTWK